MANNWKKEIEAYRERESKIAASEPASFCRAIQVASPGEGHALLEHVISYLIGESANTDIRGRSMMEQWHNELSEAYPYGLNEYSILRFTLSRSF